MTRVTLIFMPLEQLEHYLVLTADLEGTRDFYLHALGLRLGDRPPLPFPGYWLYLGDTPCLHIAEWKTYAVYSDSIGIPSSRRADATGPVDHIAFRATDHREFSARLDSAGVLYRLNTIPVSNARQLFLRDPNGVKIEVNFMPED